MNEYYRAIGRVAVTAGSVEFELGFFVWGLLDADQKLGHQVTAGEPFEALAAKVERLAKYRFAGTRDDLVERIRSFLTEARQFNTERNQVLHAAVTTGDGGLGRLRLPRSGAVQTTTYTVEQLDALAEQGHRVYSVGAAILDDIATEPGYEHVRPSSKGNKREGTA